MVTKYWEDSLFKTLKHDESKSWNCHTCNELCLFISLCQWGYITHAFKKKPFWGIARGYEGCEASRPAVLQMSWAVCYQVYVTWDYPRWHPLKANSQQYSWGGIWWRVRMWVCVHLRRYVCSCIQIGGSVWQNGSAEIRYYTSLPLSQSKTFTQSI